MIQSRNSVNIDDSSSEVSNIVKSPFLSGLEDSESGRKSWSRMEIGKSGKGQEFQAVSKWVQLATTMSWIVNWILFAVKVFVFIESSSKAVLAALADSAVDLASQAVLSLAELYINKHSPDYPVGRSRLEALSVLVCAFIMTMASVEVIQFSIVDIIDGANGNIPHLNLDLASYLVLGIVIILKFILYGYCRWANSITSIRSDSVDALAEDHLNDVFSNTTAIITAAIAFNVRSVWWMDPAGAIAISLVIIARWVAIMFEQVKKIVGHIAPKEFIEQVEQIAISHDSRLRVDCIRAYHFGARYNVEMEIVLPGNMTVMESHDIALALQHRIEYLDDVERAFVHVDHQLRDGLEHKVERQLVKGTPSPAAGLDSPTKISVAAVEAQTTESIRSRPTKTSITTTNPIVSL